MTQKKTMLHCKPPNSQKVHLIDTNEIIEDEDNEICCPPFDECLWSSHPRVYLKLDDKGEVHCPYCGTFYKLKT